MRLASRDDAALPPITLHQTLSARSRSKAMPRRAWPISVPRPMRHMAGCRPQPISTVLGCCRMRKPSPIASPESFSSAAMWKVLRRSSPWRATERVTKERTSCARRQRAGDVALIAFLDHVIAERGASRSSISRSISDCVSTAGSLVRVVMCLLVLRKGAVRRQESIESMTQLRHGLQGDPASTKDLCTNLRHNPRGNNCRSHTLDSTGTLRRVPVTPGHPFVLAAALPAQVKDKAYCREWGPATLPTITQVRGRSSVLGRVPSAPSPRTVRMAATRACCSMGPMVPF